MWSIEDSNIQKKGGIRMVLIVNMDLRIFEKLTAAVILAMNEYPEAGSMIEKRLIAITPTYFEPQAGLVIENYEGLPVVGDYHILASRVDQLSVSELASRIFAAAIILEMEEDMKPPMRTWRLGEEEIEENYEKYVFNRHILLSSSREG